MGRKVKAKLSETERALITVSVKIPEKGIFSASGWIGALGYGYPVKFVEGMCRRVRFIAGVEWRVE